MIESKCEHGNGPDCQRCEIIDAKRHLYHLLLKLKAGDLTGDDLKIGEALVLDSEIQAIIEKGLGKAAAKP